MTQYVINIGAVPNDGTGDPLRTAFNEVNLNFDQVWATGLVGSNIAVANNTIRTTNTNGNLVLAPNGVGVVQSNVSIVPNTSNIRNLGSSTQRWSSLYVQYANISGNLDLAGEFSVGDMTVTGNLTVTGNTIQIGNIVTETLTIQLANAASTANAANGSGITVGANDNIATILYSSTSNTWTTNIGISSVGNVTAPYFFGNGSQLTGVTSSYGNSNVATFLAAFGSNTISTTGNATVGNILPAGYVSATGNVRGANLNTDGVVSAVGNITGNYFIGNGSQLTGVVSTGNLEITGTVIAIAPGATETSILISPNGPTAGQAFVDVPNNVTANTANLRIYNSLGNIELGTDEGTNLWYFGNTGTLTVPGAITSAVDTSITATDDVLIYGGDKVPGGGEGGDVFIDGGNGADDNGTSVSGGGDIELTGGVGGDALDIGAGDGGFVRLVGGDGGTANSGNSIQAGEGGQIVILGGSAGDNNGNLSLNGLGGNVEIYGGSGSFDVANSRPDGPAGHVNLYGGNWGFNFVPTGNIYLNTYDGTNFKTLTYDYNGNVTMASGAALHFVGSNPGIVSGLNEDFYIRASDDENDGWSIYNVVDDGAGNILSQTRLEYNQYSITTDDQGAFPYTWAFKDTGVLELPGDIYGNVGGNLTVKIGDQAGSNTFIDLQTRSYVGDALISNIRIANPNVTISTANAAHTWTFGGTGITTFPDNTLATNDDFIVQVTDGVPTSTANINSQGGYNIGSYTGLSTTGGSGTGLTVNASTAGNGYIDTVTINAPGTGYTNGDTITIVGGDGLGCTFTVGVPTPNWTFDTAGGLALATVAGESARFVGTRKVIGGLSATSPYSITMNAGGTPTVAYTALSGTDSVKVTFAVQSNGAGFQWEQFDVVAVPSQDVGGAVNFVVSNRVKGNSTIPDTAVTATMSGGQIEISLTLDATQTDGGWASFDAVEFGLMVD